MWTAARRALLVTAFATLASCTTTAPSPVTLPPTTTGAIGSTGSAPPLRTRAYAGEPLVCAAAGSPCIYLTEDRSRTVTTATSDDAPWQELWLRRPGALDSLLAESHDGDDCNDRLAAMDHPTFSPDGRHLFVSADCAAVSPAVREIDLVRGGSRFVSDGGLIGFSTREGRLHVVVERYLLDLDHAFDDPGYMGRLPYRFDVDVMTGTATRLPD